MESKTLAPRKSKKRYYNDKGEVAYVTSPGYGTGWYTQNGNRYPDCATDPGLITLILDLIKYVRDNHDKLSYNDRRNWDYAKDEGIQTRYKRIIAYAKKKWPEGYWSGHDFDISYAPEGYMVKYEEFDGAESSYAYAPDSSLLTL